MMPWVESYRADPRAAAIADRHYNRHARQFVPPGRCLVFLTPDAGALWITSWPIAEYVQHAWAGAWICSCFRRESGPRASDLIRAAIAATRYTWPAIPPLGMVTFVDRDKVRPKRDPGRCFLRAGFRIVGETKGGLLALQIFAQDMPDPEPCRGTTATLWEATA